MTSSQANFLEHPEDVIARHLEWVRTSLEAALVIVKDTQGGAVRAVGAMMSVCENGRFAGYVSGGCIDADVILRAQQALQTGEQQELIYGAGSPFTDLPLPCGGSITVLILPSPNTQTLARIHKTLTARAPAQLYVGGDGQIDDRPNAANAAPLFYTCYEPKIKLRIAGRGADCLALAKLGVASGLPVHLQLTADTDIAAAQRIGGVSIEKLETPRQLPQANDDAWTAFILMFHDGDWETNLLLQASHGQAFYIGAVGSRKTHERRCQALSAAGLATNLIQKIRGPIGLVPSMRNASMLAVSVLAEIFEANAMKAKSKTPQTAVLLLAAGASSRFEAGDKLLAHIDDETILSKVAQMTESAEVSHRWAVIGTDQPKRREILERNGFTIIENPEAPAGQSTSLKAGLATIMARGDIDQVLIVLADMPLIPSDHFSALMKAAEQGAEAVITDADGTLMPPALFQSVHFQQLMNLKGDRGARSVFDQITNKATVPLNPDATIDIDTVADLKRAEAFLNG
jgi:xanthine dehydrogenase accessory factor